MPLPMQPVLMICGAGFLQAYAGTLHLAVALRSLGHEVRMMVRCNPEQAGQYAELELPVECLVVGEGGPLRLRLQMLKARLCVTAALFTRSPVILTENTFLIEAALAKLVRRSSIYLVHFCQELQLATDFPDLPRIRLLDRCARVPDLTIDVEPNRARVRMERLGLRALPMVLVNTLHRSSLPPRAPAGGLAAMAGRQLPGDRPLVLHMGGIGREKPLERVVDAVRACRHPVFLLAFCTGSADQIETLGRYAAARLPADSFAILGPRRRDELLASAWEADVGVIDYSVTVQDTHNQRYCAPTKLYEFMAAGLAVVGSDNASLRDVIENEHIGFCARGHAAEDLGAALERTIADPGQLARMKERAAVAFTLRHCYEVACAPTVQRLSHLLQAAR